MKENSGRRDSEDGKGRYDRQEHRPLVFSYRSGQIERWYYTFLCGLSLTKCDP